MTTTTPLWMSAGHNTTFTPDQWAAALAYNPQPSDKVAGTKYNSILDGTLYTGYAGAPRPYAISAVGSAVRFELHQGDKNFADWAANHPCDRVELASRVDPLVVKGQQFQFNEVVTFEPGNPNTSNWLVFWQLHQSIAVQPLVAGSPAVAIELVGDRFQIQARAGANGNDGQAGNKIVVQWTDTDDMVRGQAYSFVIVGVFHDLAGRLKVIRDGEVLVDYAGPLGFPTAAGYYKSYGLYRYPAPEVLAVQINTTHMYLDPLIY